MWSGLPFVSIFIILVISCAMTSQIRTWSPSCLSKLRGRAAATRERLRRQQKKEPVSERVSFARACDKNVQTLNGRNAFFAAMLRHAATSWAVPWAHLQGQRSGIAIPKRIATPQISEMNVYTLHKFFMNHARINASSFQRIFFLLHAGLVLDFFLWWR